MSSTLITTSVENLGNGINSVVRTLGNSFVVYVSLNKPHDSVKKKIEESGIRTEKIFFIDGMSSEEKDNGVICIKPSNLEELMYVIKRFVKEVNSEKYILIDSLATLLLYNNELKAAQFIKQLTEFASEEKIEVVALSQRSEGEELLKKIYNFFDKVEEKK